jgi:hypothetical protein
MPFKKRICKKDNRINGEDERQSDTSEWAMKKQHPTAVHEWALQQIMFPIGRSMADVASELGVTTEALRLSVNFAQNLALQGGDIAQGRRSCPVGS